MHLGEIVRQYREQNKKSMDEFASESGLSKGYISMLEKNINPKTNKAITPSIATIAQVSKALGVSFDEIFNMLDGQVRLSSPQNKAQTSRFSTLVEQQLGMIGYRVLFEEDDAILVLQSQDLEIEISIEDLNNLSKEMELYLRFRTNELVDRIKTEEGYYDRSSKPSKWVKPTSPKTEDPAIPTLMAAHNDNEDPDQLEKMQRDAAALLEDD